MWSFICEQCFINKLLKVIVEALKWMGFMFLVIYSLKQYFIFIFNFIS